MILRFTRLDQVDFLLELANEPAIIVHEFENDIAIFWHIKENVIRQRILDRLKTRL